MRITTYAVLIGAALQIQPAMAKSHARPTHRGVALVARNQVPLPPRRGEGGAVFAIVSRAAARHGVPQRLAHAVIAVESGHKCNARNSRSSAKGLGQLINSTARAMGVRNPMDCEQNANGAMAYLASMLRMARGNYCAAATGYTLGHMAGCNAYGRKVMRIASAGI